MHITALGAGKVTIVGVNCYLLDIIRHPGSFQTRSIICMGRDKARDTALVTIRHLGSELEELATVFVGDTPQWGI
jgi:hypothetical protein